MKSEVNTKEWKEMNLKEKVASTVSELWDLVGIIILLGIVVSVPFVIITLIIILFYR